MCVCVHLSVRLLFFSLRETKHISHWTFFIANSQIWICIQKSPSRQECLQRCHFGTLGRSTWVWRSPGRRRFTSQDDPKLNLRGVFRMEAKAGTFPGQRDQSQLPQCSPVPSVWEWSLTTRCILHTRRIQMCAYSHLYICMWWHHWIRYLGAKVLDHATLFHLVIPNCSNISNVKRKDDKRKKGKKGIITVGKYLSKVELLGNMKTWNGLRQRI